MSKERLKIVNFVNKINDEKLFKQEVLSKYILASKGERKSHAKLFLDRPSLLTILPENNIFSTMKNILLSIFIVLLLQCIIGDYYEGLMFNTGFRLLAIGFSKFGVVAVTWPLLFLSTILVYFCFHIWCELRSRTSKKSHRIMDFVFLSSYTLYVISGFYYASMISIKHDLPYATATILMVEQCRLAMKAYAFVRTNVSFWLAKPYHEEVTNTSLLKFVYFLFAPTLLYKNHYPRNKIIRWRLVLKHIFEFCVAVMFIAIIYDKIFVPFTNQAGITKHSWKELILFVLANTFIGMFLKFLVFAIVLHIMQNFFAELLKFADREFYSDWWTSVSLPTHLRKWNIVVHDWLFTFVYKDIFQLTKNKFISRMAVLFISALFHELLISVVLRAFIPVLFVQFFILGSIFCAMKEVQHPLMNSLHWFNLAFGITIQLTLYSLEYYSRANCKVTYNSAWDFFKFRFLDESCSSA